MTRKQREALELSLYAAFYEHTLKREWPTLTMIRPPTEHKLPVILSVEQAQQRLGYLRLPHYLGPMMTRSNSALFLISLIAGPLLAYITLNAINTQSAGVFTMVILIAAV